MVDDYLLELDHYNMCATKPSKLFLNPSSFIPKNIIQFLATRHLDSLNNCWLIFRDYECKPLCVSVVDRLEIIIEEPLDYVPTLEAYRLGF